MSGGERELAPTPRGARIAEIVVGLLLLASALFKALDPGRFFDQVALYRILPEPAIGPAAFAILAAETLLGAALIRGLWLRGLPHLLAGALLAFFSGVFAWGLLRHGITDCGCFGAFLELPPPVSLARNILLLAALLYAFLVRRRLGSLPAGAELRLRLLRSPAWVAAIVLMVAAVGGALAVGLRQRAIDAHDSARDRAVLVAAPDPERPYDRFRVPAEAGPLDLGRGDWFVAWLSTTCEDCKAAVAQLHELAEAFPELPPIVGLMIGDRPTLAEFRAETSPDFPTVLVPAPAAIAYIGEEPPRFVLVRDGVAVETWDAAIPDPLLLAELLLRLQLEAP